MPALRPVALRVLCVLCGFAIQAAAGIESVAVDQTGNIYTVTNTGLQVWSPAGTSLFSAPLDITPRSLAVDEDYLYGAADNQIHRFHRKDAKPAPFPAPTRHIDLGKSDPRALDVSGATLHLADALAGKIRTFDTTTGAPKTDFLVHLPTAVAVDPLGQIWVATGRDTVKAFRADGYSGVTYGGLADATALAFGPGASLYAADAKADQILKLDTAASPAAFVPVLKDVRDLRTFAVDGQDNLITVDRAGARLAKWSPARKLLWERTTFTVTLAGVTITHQRHHAAGRTTDSWTLPTGTIDLINVPLPKP